MEHGLHDLIVDLVSIAIQIVKVTTIAKNLSFWNRFEVLENIGIELSIISPTKLQQPSLWNSIYFRHLTPCFPEYPSNGLLTLQI